MAESKDSKASKKTASTDTVEPVEHVSVKAHKNKTPWGLIAIGGSVTVLVIMVAAVSWLVAVGSLHARNDRMSGNFPGYSNNDSDQRSFRRGGPAMRSFAAQGVITAINGDTITVSGGGKQVTVKKTDSTTVSGDETSIAVNDTVAVAGTTNSDGTITATRIIVRNESFFGADATNSPDI